MKEELSIARVVKSLEKAVIDNPTEELVDCYLKLVDRLNAPESATDQAERIGALDARVCFLESLQKVRVLDGGVRASHA